MTTERMKLAVEQLTNHQEQCDMDGIMVKVSREALEEVLAALRAPEADAGAVAETFLPRDLPSDTIAAVVGGGVTSDQVVKIWGLIRSALLLRDMTGSSLTGVYAALTAPVAGADAGMRERAALSFCEWLNGFLKPDGDLSTFDVETIRGELAAVQQR
jgi:hypothetical protein